MEHKLKILFVFLCFPVVGILSSCSKTASPAGAAAGTSSGSSAYGISDLEGKTLKSACVDGGSDGSRNELTATSNGVGGFSVGLTVHLYTDRTCADTSTEYLTIYAPRTVVQTAVSNAATNMISTTTVTGNSFMTPQTAGMATTFNNFSACGFSDWVNGVTKNVTGISCPGLTDFSAAGVTSYGSSWITKTGGKFSIQFDLQDATYDGSTPSKRSTTPDPDAIYTEI